MGKPSSFIFLLARKFLISKNSDHFLSFITLVSVGGVALGVLALALVTSVINGFEGELTRVITAMNGEVLLFSRTEPLEDPVAIEEEIRRLAPETKAVTHSLMAELMLSGPAGVAGGILDGVDLASLSQVVDFKGWITQGRLPESTDELVLGGALAEKLGAVLGSMVTLVIPLSADGESPPKACTARLVGIARLGMYDYDSKFAFMTLESVQAFLGIPNAVTNFTLRLKDPSQAREVASRLHETFSYPFKVKDWSQLNRNLFRAIELEKAVIAIIITVIIVVAAFNVVSTLMMLIHEKSQEIAILKAMGLKSSESFRLFCLIGTGIGMLGSSLGITLAYLLAYGLEKTRWIKLPSDIYFIDFLPVSVHGGEFATIGLLAVLISFLATLFPAWIVSHRSPLEGLRYE